MNRIQRTTLASLVMIVWCNIANAQRPPVPTPTPKIYFAALGTPGAPGSGTIQNVAVEWSDCTGATSVTIYCLDSTGSIIAFHTLIVNVGANGSYTTTFGLLNPGSFVEFEAEVLSANNTVIAAASYPAELIEVP